MRPKFIHICHCTILHNPCVCCNKSILLCERLYWTQTFLIRSRFSDFIFSKAVIFLPSINTITFTLYRIERSVRVLTHRPDFHYENARTWLPWITYGSGRYLCIWDMQFGVDRCMICLFVLIAKMVDPRCTECRFQDCRFLFARASN